MEHPTKSSIKDIWIPGFKILGIIFLLALPIKFILIQEADPFTSEIAPIIEREDPATVESVLNEFDYWANQSGNSYQLQVRYFMDYAMREPEKAVMQWNQEVYDFFESYNFNTDSIVRYAIQNNIVDK